MSLSAKRTESIRHRLIAFSRLGKELGVDPNVILATSHGRRSIDVLKLYDGKKANWECKQVRRAGINVQKNLTLKNH